MKSFLIYLAIINALAIYIMNADKNRSRHSIYRIPERVFFIISAIGGSLGVLFGMHHYRHKTRKLSFKIGIPLIAVAQLVLLIMYWVYC